MRLLVCIALLTAALPARAANYVVSPGGSDGGDGSAAHPWKTLQHAADQAQAGDVVTVQPGTYAGFEIGFSTPKSGTAGMPITFKAMPGTIVNSVNDKTMDGIDLEGASYITLDGFEVTGAPRAGIRTVSDGNSNATNVVIQRCNAHDNGTWGIFTSHVDNLLIAGNRASKSGSQHGIYVSNACVNPTVRGNIVFSNYANGIHMNGDASQGGTGIITGALVEKNIIYDNGTGGGSGINCDGVQKSLIQNNLIYAEHASGISLFKQDAAQPALDNVIVSNTIQIAADGRWAVNIQNGSTGNTVLDNILLDDHAGHGAIDTSADSASGLTSDYNVVVDAFTPDDNTVLTLAKWQAMTGQDKHSLIASAAMLFVGGSDHHLVMGAPAIGKGTTMHAPADDLDGHARGGSIDVGAYQYCDGCSNGDGGAGGPAGTDDGGAAGGMSNGDMSSLRAPDAGAGGVPKRASGCSCDVGGAAGDGGGELVVIVAALLSRVTRRRRELRGEPRA